MSIGKPKRCFGDYKTLSMAQEARDRKYLSFFAQPAIAGNQNQKKKLLNNSGIICQKKMNR